jgi:potassium/hydrogen antiporter
MQYSFNTLLLIGSVLLLFSILLSKTTARISIPSLILFIGIGMFAGSDLVGIYFDDFVLAQQLGIVALTLILFSGGLDTNWQTVKPILGKGIALSTIGILITTFSVGLFTSWIAGFTLLEGLLLGAIVSSTDAAAVFSVLRGKSLGLKGKLKPILELESGSNDPMAYFLMVSIIYLIKTKDASVLHLIPEFCTEFIIGGLFGWMIGLGSIWFINRIRLDFEGLYSVLVFALIFFAYSACDALGGNGFLAIYIMGIIMGNRNFIHKKSIIRFYDGQAWLVQIVMFLLLGLVVFPQRIVPIMGTGLLVSFFLMFVARPLGVFVSLSLSGRCRLKDKVFISWVGLRGAVPIIFATYPLIENVSRAQEIFNIVFFTVITSVLIQGTSIGYLSRKLRVYVPEKIKRRFPLDLGLEDDIKGDLTEIQVPSGSNSAGRSIMDLNLPATSLIILIERNGQHLQPRASTVIEEGDKLYILTKNEHDFTLINDVLTK